MFGKFAVLNARKRMEGNGRVNELEGTSVHRMERTVDDLTFQTFKTAYEEELHRYDGLAGASATFNYAFALILQPKKKPELIKRGNELIRSLYNESHDELAKRDYLYYLAIGEAKLGFFDEAIRFVDAILSMEPDNNQALELKEEIKQMRYRDGLTGAAIAGGFIGVAGLLGAAIVGLITFGKGNSR
ncbi:hypothetical protein ACOME3_003667 [Neoechinorhynchus agilis]